ncbi:hypothetical protein Tco_0434295 [Tanacetum coccineum]
MSASATQQMAQSHRQNDWRKHRKEKALRAIGTVDEQRDIVSLYARVSTSRFPYNTRSADRRIPAKTKAKLKESRTPLVGFSGEVSYPIGTITLSVTMGESERLRTIPMEFTVVKSHSHYNVILGQTGLRNLRAVASTIHSIIKFLTTNGIATMTTMKETLQECQRIKEARGPTREGRITFPQTQTCDSEGTTNRGREESLGQTDKVEETDGTIQPSPIPSKKDAQTDEKGGGKIQDNYARNFVDTKSMRNLLFST